MVHIIALVNTIIATVRCQERKKAACADLDVFLTICFDNEFKFILGHTLFERVSITIRGNSHAIKDCNFCDNCAFAQARIALNIACLLRTCTNHFGLVIHLKWRKKLRKCLILFFAVSISLDTTNAVMVPESA